MKEQLCCCIVHLCFTILECFINCIGKLNALFSDFNVFTSKVGTVVRDSNGRAAPQIVSHSLVSPLIMEAQGGQAVLY